MSRLVDRKNSIYLQMVTLLLLATIASAVLFFLVGSASESIVDYYMEKTDYAETQNRKRIDSLQDYIDREELCSHDSAKIYQWVQEQNLLTVSIYKDGIQVFDSDYPEHEIWDDEIGFANYDWMSYDTISFSDGTAEVQISGAYRYQILFAVRIAALVLSFLLFLVIVIRGIRIKMAYILQLSREVEILEAGSLDYRITVKGKDELSMLADGLESMRRSFLDSRTKEEDMVRKNQRVITEMSHDLRTPVTSILLYTEILKMEKCQDESQKRMYLEKIRQKAIQLKQRTDRLLEYSLEAKDRSASDMMTGSFTGVIFEPLSEACGYLEQKGFTVDVKPRWTEQQIRYHVDYVLRIIENITSNIVKYADKEEVVIIETIQEESRVGLLFRNRIGQLYNSAESNGIGIQSIDNLMREMGGDCHALRSGNEFRIMVCFPVINIG